jgi:acyl-coenzyme A thioesterase PaaI-like protein
MSENGSFADASAVTEVEEAAIPAETRRFTAEIRPGWDIAGNANGGYLMAIAGRAMAEAIGRPPLSITAHYLRPGPPGPCTVEVETVRVGRRLATARATMTIGGKPALELLGTFGDQQPDPDGPRWEEPSPSDLPPYSSCVPMLDSASNGGPALIDRLACRLRPGDDAFRHGEPTGVPEIKGWFAFQNDEPIDVFALLLAVDAFAPPVFNSHITVAWVPTVELTVHIRGIPAPGPLACSFRSRFIHDGLLDEEGEIWDSAGRLVAQSRQLSIAPRPT